MSGCKIFSKIDLKRAYHQVQIVSKDQNKTSINTTIGVFKFKRMPFGLKNAGQCFQRNIHAKLASLPFVYCLMDDLIVTRKSEEEHFMQMEKLLHALNV